MFNSWQEFYPPKTGTCTSPQKEHRSAPQALDLWAFNGCSPPPPAAGIFRCCVKIRNRGMQQKEAVFLWLAVKMKRVPSHSRSHVFFPRFSRSLAGRSPQPSALLLSSLSFRFLLGLSTFAHSGASSMIFASCIFAGWQASNVCLSLATTVSTIKTRRIKGSPNQKKGAVSASCILFHGLLSTVSVFWVRQNGRPANNLPDGVRPGMGGSTHERKYAKGVLPIAGTHKKDTRVREWTSGPNLFKTSSRF